MDLNKYIESGILEEFVFGTLSTDEMVEVHELSLQHPQILEAINAIDASVIPNIAIPAPSGLLDKIMADLPNENYTEVSNEAPPSPSPAVEKPSNTGLPGWLFALLGLVLLGSIYYNFSMTAGVADLKEANSKLKTEYTQLESSCAADKDRCNKYLDLIREGYEPIAMELNLEGKPNSFFFRHREKFDVQFVAESSLTAPQGKQLQAWRVIFNPKGDVTGYESLGILKNDTQFQKLRNAKDLTHFAISIEDAGPEKKDPNYPAGIVGAQAI